MREPCKGRYTLRRLSSFCWSSLFALMELTAKIAAWCSLLWALAAVHTLRESSAQQRRTATKHGSGKLQQRE